MTDDHDSGLARLEELDRRYLRANIAIAVLVPLQSLLLLDAYGILIVIFSAVPLVSALLGLVALRQWLGLVRWYVLHLGLVSLAAVGSALLTGGAASPLFQMLPAAGLLWVSYFPEHRTSVAVAPAMAVTVVAWSWSTDPLRVQEEVLVILSTLVVSLIIPLFAVRLVETELLHRRRAVIDHLTGCLNRYALASRTGELQAQLDLVGETVGVVIFDVDHFKRINDAFGHSAGDAVLQDLTYAVRKRLRRFELFYRLGGEEFLILLAGAAEDEAILLADAVREAASTVIVGDSPVTVSCGVAMASQDRSIDEAVLRADEALYRAKHTGRNRTVAHGREHDGPAMLSGRGPDDC